MATRATDVRVSPRYAHGIPRVETDADRIARHKWPPFVECSYCGDTGLHPDGGGECFCEKGIDATYARVRDESWHYGDIVPRRFRDLCLDSHPNAALVDSVRMWLETNPVRNGENLVLLGGVGRGKTGAAIAALREMHYDGALVRYWSLPDLMDQLRADEFSRGQTDELRKKPTMPYLRDCDCLLLDDMGTERPTKFAIDRLYLIINGRSEQGLPTIFTTNQSKENFLEHLGPPCASRVQQSIRWINVTGPDLRGVKR
jgi:hypothetical protein